MTSSLVKMYQRNQQTLMALLATFEATCLGTLHEKPGEAEMYRAFSGWLRLATFMP